MSVSDLQFSHSVFDLHGHIRYPMLSSSSATTSTESSSPWSNHLHDQQQLSQVYNQPVQLHTLYSLPGLTESNMRSLAPIPIQLSQRQYTEPPLGWELQGGGINTYNHSLPQNHVAPPPYSNSSPYSPPSSTPSPLNSSFTQHSLHPVLAHDRQNVSKNRITLSGSLDPSTGIFYRAPEHPRLRTAQACDKCRTRKAKVV